MADSQGRGQAAEQQAAEFLRQQGLVELQRNYRVKGGEIDLVMRDGPNLVFVEVRYRRSQRYGGAIESVTPQKQARLAHAAQHYLQQHRLDLPCRFDVIAIEDRATPNWIRNAFQTG